MAKAARLQALPVPTHGCWWLCAPHAAVLFSEPLPERGANPPSLSTKTEGIHQQTSLQITTGGYPQPLTLLRWDAGLAHCPLHLPTPPHPPLTLGSLFSLFPLCFPPTEGKRVHHAGITLGARIHPKLCIELQGGTRAEVSSPIPPAPPASVTPPPGHGATPVSHPAAGEQKSQRPDLALGTAAAGSIAAAEWALPAPGSLFLIQQQQ